MPWKYRPSLVMSRNEFLCVSGDRYKKFFRPKRTILFSKPEEKNNGINIIAKNNEEEEYPYISICGPHGYRRHKVRLLVILNQGSTLFADGDTSNAFVTYNFWREHGLIIVDPKRPKQFRLDMINQNSCLPWSICKKPSLNQREDIFHDLNEIMKKLMSTSLMWVNCFH